MADMADIDPNAPEHRGLSNSQILAKMSPEQFARVKAANEARGSRMRDDAKAEAHGQRVSSALRAAREGDYEP